MTQPCENIYKIYRNSAGLTQEYAAELLNIATRTLSAYENSEIRVPDNIVAVMSDKYNSLVLAWKHLQQTSILSKFLPDIVIPQNNSDMFVQLILAQDDLKPAVDEIKKLMSNGKFADDRKSDFKKPIETIKQINAKLISVILYAG